MPFSAEENTGKFSQHILSLVVNKNKPIWRQPKGNIVQHKATKTASNMKTFCNHARNCVSSRLITFQAQYMTYKLMYNPPHSPRKYANPPNFLYLYPSKSAINVVNQIPTVNFRSRDWNFPTSSKPMKKMNAPPATTRVQAIRLSVWKPYRTISQKNRCQRQQTMIGQDFFSGLLHIRLEKRWCSLYSLHRRWT